MIPTYQKQLKIGGIPGVSVGIVKDGEIVLRKDMESWK
ncbi:hypothetical protein JCM19296_3549 [Nonlabens ulvanivorans]|uniref:Uncharacterized protein n=1 Tax=Nonlabens ulvanivorans TaxID=906888 RepID=A0A081DG94_NONUL|nr:hypothetical protein JCM19296_3549 [Nonlabens ulvanivorans]